MKDISIEKILNEVIKRILSVVRPKKIILFGSAVREEMHANSDIEQFKENIGMIIRQALDEGRVLYAA